jgi:hypothetical protein
MISAAGGVFGGDQRATETLVVFEESDRDIFRCGIDLKAVTDEQSGIHVIELVVVLAPVGSAVQPVAFVAFEVGDAGEIKFLKIVRLMKRVLQVGIATVRVDGSIFVDACSLRTDGPGGGPVEASGDLSAVRAGDTNEIFERLGVNK